MTSDDIVTSGILNPRGSFFPLHLRYSGLGDLASFCFFGFLDKFFYGPQVPKLYLHFIFWLCLVFGMQFFFVTSCDTNISLYTFLWCSGSEHFLDIVLLL